MKIETRVNGGILDAHKENFAVILGIAEELRPLNLTVVEGFIWLDFQRHKPTPKSEDQDVKPGPAILYLTPEPEHWRIGKYRVACDSVMRACPLTVQANYKCDRPNIHVDEAIWPDRRKDYDHLTEFGPRTYYLECPDSIELAVEHAKKAATELDILHVYSTMG